MRKRGKRGTKEGHSRKIRGKREEKDGERRRTKNRGVPLSLVHMKIILKFSLNLEPFFLHSYFLLATGDSVLLLGCFSGDLL